MFPWSGDLQEDEMFDDVLDIEELTTTDSVGEANRLLQQGWDLLGFHPAPAAPGGSFGSATTIFVMARLADYDDELDDVDLELEELEPLPS
jgi:hypothetical protein